MVHSILTPWIRVLPEKLNGFQLLKKFPLFYGTQRFITSFKSARHLSLSWATSIQSIPTHKSHARFPLSTSYQSSNPCPRLLETFRNRTLFTVRSCYHLAQTPSWRTTLVGFPRLLIQYIRSYRPYWRTFLLPQPADVPCLGDRDTLITENTL
jgi:hypothetical protein